MKTDYKKLIQIIKKNYSLLVSMILKYVFIYLF